MIENIAKNMDNGTVYGTDINLLFPNWKGKDEKKSINIWHTEIHWKTTCRSKHAAAVHNKQVQSSVQRMLLPTQARQGRHDTRRLP